VFATSSRVFATVFLGKPWSDTELEFGRFSQDQPMYLREQHPGVFERIYKGQQGWLYHVDASRFSRDPRTGMREEFISRAPVPISKTTRVNGVWDALLDLQKKGQLVLITFEQYAKLMRGYVGRRIK